MTKRPKSNAAASASADALLPGVECVVSDPLKFKRKLQIGEEAYALLRLKNGIQKFWDVGGVAATGATVAASHAVAATFFAATGPAALLSVLGIGAAATPVGWVIAAAAVSGGAYYGIGKMVRAGSGAMVDTIPKFISTPMDVLGMSLFDLMGSLALRIAKIDGEVVPAERESIRRHFVEEWGFDNAYVIRALELIEGAPDGARTKAIAQQLADFQASNPDCNAEAMQKELLAFLREVMEADGVLDEREEHGIDAIADVFRKSNAMDFKKVQKGIADFGQTTTSAVTEMTRNLGKLVPRK